MSGPQRQQSSSSSYRYDPRAGRDSRDQRSRASLSDLPQPVGTPQRPGSPRVIALRVNCYPITQLPQHKAFQYHLDFYKYSQPRGPTQERQLKPLPFSSHMSVFDMLQRQNPEYFNPRWAFDTRSIAWSTKQLPSSPMSFNVSANDDRSVLLYMVRLQYATTIDPDHLSAVIKGESPLTPEALHARTYLTALIHMAPRSAENFPRTATAMFLTKHKHSQDGLFEYWLGYHMAVKLARNRALINVDTCLAPMYSARRLPDLLRCNQDFSRFLDSSARSMFVGDRQRRTIEKFLKPIKVTLLHRESQRVCPILGVEWKTPSQVMFVLKSQDEEMADGTPDKEISVQTYLKQYFNYTVELPNWPCVRISRNAIVPMELCKVIQGQQFRGALDDVYRSEILRLTTLAPSERFRRIEGSEQHLRYQSSDFINTTGMRVASGMLTVQGRIMSHPPLVVKDRANGVPTYLDLNKGKQGPTDAWNMMDHRVAQAPTNPATIAVAYTDRSQESAVGAILMDGAFARCLNDLGIQFTGKPVCDLVNPQALKSQLSEFVRCKFSKRPKILLVIVVIPRRSDLQRAVKQWGDIEYGILTQIVNAETLSRIPKNRPDQFLRNLALKMNLKMGGVNTEPRPHDLKGWVHSETMVMGIDSSHPAPGNGHRPSMIGVVWSTDRLLTRYCATILPQVPRMEVLSRTDMATLTKEAISGFKGVRGNNPARIIVYRDGLSEGELARAKTEEIEGIRDGVAEIVGKKAETLITYIVVTKRHHIRFQPVDERDGGKTGNAPSGTLVNHDIISPDREQPEFYLLSQGGLLGTSVPARYTVLLDEQVKRDEQGQKLVDARGLFVKTPLGGQGTLYALSYLLCHTQQRATRVVSLPTPVYYAHLVAARDFHFDYSDEQFPQDAHGNPAPQSLDWYRHPSRFRRAHNGLTGLMYFT